MKNVLLFLILTLGISINSYADDLGSVRVYYTYKGVYQNDYVPDLGSITIDEGTTVDVRIYKASSAPTYSEYYLGLPDGNTLASGSVTNSYWDFNNIDSNYDQYNLLAFVNAAAGWVRFTIIKEIVQTGDPDLVPFAYGIRPDRSMALGEFFLVGDEISTYTKIYNKGQAAAGSSSVGYYLEDTQNATSNRINSDGVPALNPGEISPEESDSYTFTDADVGVKYVVFFVDRLNEVDEGTSAKESNNIISYGPIEIKPRPIQLTFSMNEPSTRVDLIEGENTINFSWTGTGPEGSTVQIYLDNDQNTDNYIRRIYSGTDLTGSSSHTSTFTPGTYYIWGGIAYSSSVVLDHASGYIEVTGQTYTISGKATSNLNNFDVIPNATIIVGDNAEWQTTTDYKGEYSISNIPAGVHNVKISHAGQGYFWEGTTELSYTKSVNVDGDKTVNFLGACRSRPEITYDIPETFTPGEPLNITVTLTNANFAVDGVPAYLDVSFPDFTEVTSDVTVVSQSGFDANPQLIQAGTNICKLDVLNNTVDCLSPADWLLVSGVRNATISWNSPWTYTLQVIPPDVSQFKIHIKGSIGDQRWPIDGIEGQQGYLEEEKTILNEYAIVPSEWGEGVNVSPTDGYNIATQNYVIKEYMNGQYCLVFNQDKLVLDEKTVDAVLMYHNLYMNDYGLFDFTSSINKWEKIKTDWGEVIIERNSDYYRKKFAKNTMNKTIVRGGAAIGGFIGATAWVHAHPGAPVTATAVAIGGVLSFAGVAIKGVFDYADAYAAAIPFDELSVLERYNLFRAIKFLESQEAAMNYEETINNMLEVKGKLLEFSTGGNGAWNAFETCDNIYKVAKAVKTTAELPLVISDLTLQFVAEEVNKTIEVKIDEAANEWLLIVSMDDHINMLTNLSSEIANTYKNMQNSDSKVEVIENIISLPILLNLYNGNYSDALNSQKWRIDAFSANLGEIHDFKYTSADYNPLVTEAIDATAYYESFKNKTTTDFNYLKELYNTTKSSYVSLGINLNNDDNIIELDIPNSTINPLHMGGTTSQIISLNNLKDLPIQVDNIVCENSNFLLTSPSLPITIEANTNKSIELNFTTNTTNHDIINNRNSVLLKIYGSCANEDFDDEMVLNFLVKPTIEVKSVSVERGNLSSGETATINLYIDSPEPKAVSIYVQDKNDIPYFVKEQFLIAGKNNFTINYLIPEDIANGSYALKIVESSNYFSLSSRLFRKIPKMIEGDLNQFDFSNISIISSEEDFEIAERLKASIANSEILYTEGLTAGELLPAMQNDNLVLIGGDQANLLVEDLVYRGIISSGLWSQPGDAHVIAVNDPFAPVAPAGNKAIVVAGYDLEDSFMAGLRLLNELEKPRIPHANPATNVSQTQFIANWSTSENATGYYLEVATDDNFNNYVSGFENKDIGNNTSSVVTGLTANTNYYYRVRAYNETDVSENSETIHQKTLAEDAVIVSIEISGELEVLENNSSNYTCKAIYNDGTEEDMTTEVIWSCASIYANIDQSGQLTTQEVVNDEPIIIEANLNQLSDNILVTVKNIPACEPDWTIVNYINSTTAYCRVTIEGVPAAADDKIAAFAGDECRGIGDIVIDNGIAYSTILIQGETIETVTFKVWDTSECAERDVCGSWQTNPGGNIGYPPDYIIADVCTDATQTVALNSGWNLKSFYVDTGEETMENLFGALNVNILQVKSMTQSWDPSVPSYLNTLTTLSNNEVPGFFVKAGNTDSFDLTGPYVGTDHSKPALNSGWNLIGYPYDICQEVTAAYHLLLSGSKLEQVKSMIQSFDPDVPSYLNTLTHIDPGEGYFINVNASVSNFVYPESAGCTKSAKIFAVHSTGWEFTGYPESMIAYGKVTFDDLPVTENAYVGAFVGDECRAVTPLIAHEGESFVSMVINGTDEEDVEFRLWKDGVVYKSTTSLTTKPGGSTGTIIPIRFSSVATVAEPSEVEQHAKLTTSPNPFSSDLKINVILAETDDFGLKIYSADSRLIRAYQKENAQAGTHQFVWDAKDYAGNSCAPGMYFIHLNSSRGNSVQKVIFNK